MIPDRRAVYRRWVGYARLLADGRLGLPRQGPKIAAEQQSLTYGFSCGNRVAPTADEVVIHLQSVWGPQATRI